MVDASSQRDLREASVYQPLVETGFCMLLQRLGSIRTFMLPKLYMKMLYCVGPGWRSGLADHLGSKVR